MPDIKKKLEDMINNIIDGNEDTAKVDFHEYMSNRTKEWLHNQDVVVEPTQTTKSK